MQRLKSAHVSGILDYVPEERDVMPHNMIDVQAQFVRDSALIRGFIISLVGDLGLADDIFQEVFLVISRKEDEFTGGNFQAWVRQICRFQVLAHLKTQRRERRRLAGDTIDLLCSETDESADIWDSERRALSICLEKLNERQRQMLILRYRDELTPTDIAVRSEASESSVNSILTRVRKMLRDCVDRSLRRGAMT